MPCPTGTCERLKMWSLHTQQAATITHLETRLYETKQKLADAEARIKELEANGKST